MNNYQLQQLLRQNKTQNLKNSKYERPKKTYTDPLQTTKAMKEKLKNYDKVQTIDDVPLGTHVRYVTWKEGKQRFCLGGLLREKHSKYVKLSNNNFHWSVQKQHFDNNKRVIFNTVFFRVKSKQNNVNLMPIYNVATIEQWYRNMIDT